MGPGYFPTVLGIALIVLGIVIAVAALSPKAAAEKVDKFAWSTLLLILGPVGAVRPAARHPRAGPVPVMLVAVSSYASHEFSWKATLVNAAVLVALCLVVFVYALKLQFPLWPAFFGA